MTLTSRLVPFEVVFSLYVAMAPAKASPVASPTPPPVHKYEWALSQRGAAPNTTVTPKRIEEKIGHAQCTRRVVVQRDLPHAKNNSL